MCVKEAERKKVFNGTISNEDARIFFALETEHRILDTMFSDGIWAKFKRSDGGNWGFIGVEAGEECRLPKSCFSNNGNMGNCFGKTYRSIMAAGYYCHDKTFGERLYDVRKSWCPPCDMLIAFDSYKYNGFRLNRLSQNDVQALTRAVETGYAAKTYTGRIIPRMLVFKNNIQEVIFDNIKEEPEYKQVCDEYKKMTDAAKKIVARYSMERFRDDFDYYVAMLIDTRSVMARLWLDRGLYTGGHSQIVGIYFD